MTATNSETLFTEIVNKVTNTDNSVIAGKMMSSPGLKYNGKVFAFHHKENMGFRLGPKFDPVKFRVLSATPLSPFKTKPPLKGWFMVHETESNQWELLTDMALEFTKTL